jgi:murein tripeptide amidase MpaA
MAKMNDSVSMAYKRGRASKVNLVAESLFKMATNEKNPNVIAALFYLKASGGNWVESQPEVEQQTINITYAPTQGRVEKEVFSPAPESIDHAPEQG